MWNGPALPYSGKTREGRPCVLIAFLPNSNLYAGEWQHHAGHWIPCFWATTGHHYRDKSFSGSDIPDLIFQSTPSVGEPQQLQEPQECNRHLLERLEAAE